MQNIFISTYQNVNLIINTGHLGKRIGAYFIDLVIIIAYVWGMIWFWGNISTWLNIQDELSQVFIVLSLFPAYLYSFWTEFLFNGQTIGKKILKIKVVKINGYHCGFTEYWMRWLFRIVDIYPFMFLSLFFSEVGAIIGVYLTGIPALISILTSKEGQRIGDKLAGTTVISLKEKKNINKLIYTEIVDSYVPIYVQALKLSDHDMKIIKDTFENCKKNKDYATVKKLRKKLEEVMEINTAQGDIAFVETVIKDFNYYTKELV